MRVPRSLCSLRITRSLCTTTARARSKSRAVANSIRTWRGVRRGLQLWLAVLAAGGALLIAAAVESTARASGGAERGTLEIAFRTGDLDYVDPALAYTPGAWVLLHAACARLMNYPDEQPPAGFRVVPEVAAGPPRISSDGKTFTFKIRGGFRFSDGTPVRASAFERAIVRTLSPGIRSPGAQYTQEIVGAQALQSGKSTTLAGVVARGSQLVIKLRRPIPDFAARTTMPFFCAVPPNLPVDPEGMGAFPSAGPYFVSEYVRGERAVLSRNPFYGGARPHRVKRFLVDLRGGGDDEVIARVERGQADWGLAAAPFYLDPERKLVAKYGVNRGRLFVKPGLQLRAYVLNTSRPLFRDNLALRQAVNFAVDRTALVRAGGGGSLLSGRPTDQYLPPSMPGFRDAHIYPLAAPDLPRARALARGHLRSAKAVLWTFAFPPAIAQAQIVKRNLRKIGVDVEVKGLPPPALFSRVAQPNAAFDIAFFNFSADYVDPFSFTNLFFDSRFLGANNWAHFNSPKYDRLLRRAAGLQGDARYRAYGALDVQLARDAAPIVAVAYDNTVTLVSKRVGCVVLNFTGLNLAAACLK